MMSRNGLMFWLFVFCLLFICVAGCASPTTTVITLNREKYNPKLNPKDYEFIKDKVILFHSIVDLSKDSSNWIYYNPEKTVAYKLYYDSPEKALPQPVVSFLWYAMEKGFLRMGVIIDEQGIKSDAELNMYLKSLTDSEAHFVITTTCGGKLAYKKAYAVKAPGDISKEESALEQRAYDMFDSILKVIMDDPDFRKMFVEKEVKQDKS